MRMRWAATDGNDDSSTCEEDTSAAKPVALPKFSPVPWLTQDSWVSMSNHEKESFLDHILEGNFPSHQQLQLTPVHDRYYATQGLFNKADIDFGNGVDRVVLGHGPRRVLILVGIHGNEPCGVLATAMILQKKQLISSNTNITAEDLLQDENWATQLKTLFDSLTIECSYWEIQLLYNKTDGSSGRI